MGTPELTLCLKDSQVLSPGKAGPVCQIFTFFLREVRISVYSVTSPNVQMLATKFLNAKPYVNHTSHIAAPIRPLALCPLKFLSGSHPSERIEAILLNVIAQLSRFL